MIIDKFKRIHNYLRISLTDNCNLRCFYCMPDDEYEFTPSSKLMQPSEILAISKVFAGLGVNKIRLTGGEPLVRKEAGEIIESLSALPVTLTLTTNATRLHHYFDKIKSAGIRSINISLDSLEREKFLLTTRRDQFQVVKDNIDQAIQKGFHVKVNMVVIKGLNDTEINNFVEWTKYVPVHVRFIEFMPFNGNKWTGNKVFTFLEIMEEVRRKFEPVPLKNGPNDTAKAFRIAGHAGTFAIIGTMSSPFCSGCNRMRLTADGKLKNCLFSKDETDLLTAYRSGQNIVPLIHQSIESKYEALGGQMGDGFEYLQPGNIENRSMITIGG